MAAFDIVTWNSATNAQKRRPSNTTTFDFLSVKVGADAIEISQSGSGASAAFNFNNRILTGVAQAVSNSDVPNFAQMNAAIDLAVLTGGRLKEAVLIDAQISASLGVRAAAVFYTLGTAAIGDTVTLTDGTNNATWTFSSSSATQQPATGASAAASMQNLASRINSDSTVWGAQWVPTALSSIDPGGVVVIYEKSTAAGSSTSRFYGTFATPTNAKAQYFNTQTEYKTSATVIQMPSADPGAGRFGFRRQLSALSNGEIHYIHETDALKSWDGDGGSWVTLSSGGLPDATAASGGGVKGKVTFDSDLGIGVTGGVAFVKTDGQGLGFSAGNLAIQLNGATLNKSGSGLKVADAGITATQLATSVAGNGLTGGAGTALAVVAQDGIRSNNTGVSVDYTEQFQNDNAGAITVRQVVYEKSNGRVDLAIATNTALSQAKIGLVYDSSISAAATGAITMREGAKITGFSGLTVGSPVYVSQSVAGALTQDLSAFVAGDQVYKVGYAISATAIIFEPNFMLEL